MKQAPVSENDDDPWVGPLGPTPNLARDFAPKGNLLCQADSLALRIRCFRKKHYFETADMQWNDWRWQFVNRITTLEALEAFVRLTADERGAFSNSCHRLPFAITPYYLSLIHPSDPTHPLRRAVIPSSAETLIFPHEADDPLDEDRDSPVPGLVHRYPDRVLFVTTLTCATYCRYCTRSRSVGHGASGAGTRKNQWQRCLEYIRGHQEVRDVLLSGGDPLTLSDDQLDWLLEQLGAIRHVEIVRIGTKVPVVLPQRITGELIRVLRRHHPLWMSIHFTHPLELTEEVIQATARLADAGIPLGSQTVLLRGINDEVQTMTSLYQGLLQLRVRPYYLYQCDRIKGSEHFRTKVERGLEIIRGLRGHTSGYAVPTYVVDAPGGGGKIPLLPEYYVGRENDSVVLKNYQGRAFRYPDPPLHDWETQVEGAAAAMGLR